VQHARMTSRLDWVGQRQSISALTLLVVPLLHKQIFAPPSYERIHLARAVPQFARWHTCIKCKREFSCHDDRYCQSPCRPVTVVVS
jgi:hypothetical protein